VRSKTGILSVVFILVVVLDIITKRWAMEALSGGSSEIFGGVVPLTLMFNRGAAFGLSVGGDPRLFFIPVTIIALILLAALLVRTEPQDRFRLLALSLVFSGAFGNLIDRVRWNQGVVDFIGPIDLGFMDWPIFNVADMAISCGAVALAISFWTEEQSVRKTDSEVPAEGEPEAMA
jgi:signal peptidase II